MIKQFHLTFCLFGLLGLSSAAWCQGPAQPTPTPTPKPYVPQSSLSPSLLSNGRRTWISGSIEPTYRKSSTPPKPELDPSGTPQPTPPPVPWTDPPVWRIQNKPTLYYDRTEHTLAELVGSPFSEENAGWYGTGAYYGNAEGFLLSDLVDFTTTCTGGTPLGLQVRLPMTFTHNSANYGDQGLLLGTDTNGHILNRSTVLTYQATLHDAFGNALPSPYPSKYTIRWHEMIENEVESDETKTHPQTSYTVAPAMVTGSEYIPWDHYESTSEENKSLEVWVEPSMGRFLIGLSSTDWTVVGVLWTVGTAGIGAPAVTVEAGVVKALSPKAIRGILQGLAITGVAYVATTNGPPASEKVICKNDSATWQQALKETQDAMAGNHSTNQDVRIDPPSILDFYSGSQLTDTRFEINPLWSECEMTPWVKRVYEYHFLKGDGYDAHGYTGIGYEQIDYPEPPQVLGYYAFKGTPPTP